MVKIQLKFNKYVSGKESVFYSLLVTMLILMVTASLISFAFSPHTVFDLLTTTKIEITNEKGEIVHGYNARINTATIPNLPPGIYLIFIDGQHRETFAIEKEDKPVTPVTELEVRIKNIDGILAVQWETEKQPRTYTPTIDIETWLKEIIIVLSEANVSMLMATMITLFLLLTFNTAALAGSVNTNNVTFTQYLMNGSLYFFGALKTSIIWTVFFGAILVPLSAILSIYSVPNIITGLIVFAVFFTIQQINRSAFVIGFPISIILGIVGSQLPEIVIIILLVAAIHIINPLTAKSIDVAETGDIDEMEQSWKESLS